MHVMGILGFTLISFASGDEGLKKMGACLTNGASIVKSQFPSLIKDIEAALETPYDQFIKSQAESQQAMTQALVHKKLAEDATGLPSDFTPHRQVKLPDGTIQHQYYAVDMKGEDWSDPAKIREHISKNCQDYFPKYGSMCVEAYFKKMENLQAFLKTHDGEIQEMMAKALQNPQITWRELTSGKKFERDGVTDSNLKYGFIPALVSEDSVLSGPVFNSQGRPVGALLEVALGNETQHFFCEYNGSSFVVDNAYYFAFGGVSDKEFNKKFKEKYGELRYRAFPGGPLTPLP